jgi:hypothetical protein
MALESKQEKLADVLSRLHQNAKAFDIDHRDSYARTSDFWDNLDRDLVVQEVPAQTFQTGTRGTHYYGGYFFDGKWRIGIVAWFPPKRVVNPLTAKEVSHLVAMIPMQDDDHVLAALREVALAMPRKTDNARSRPSHD